MRLFRNAAVGITLALLAFALSFAIIAYGPRRYVVVQNHCAEQALWNGDKLFLTVRSGGFAHSEFKAGNGTRDISAAELAALRALDPTPHPRRNPVRLALRLAYSFIYLLIPFAPLLVSLISILGLKTKLLANLPEHASFPNVFPQQFTAL